MADDKYLLVDILRQVSRSFYLTLRILPAAVRHPIALAYLLARAADTLADTPALPPSKRLEYMRLFQRQVEEGATNEALDRLANALNQNLTHVGEQALLAQLPQLFALFQSQGDDDKARINAVVHTLTSGMVFDLETFAAQDGGDIRALASDDELDYYTYMVAGCVGEFWTQVSCAHIAALKDWDEDHFCRLGVRFGKALQLTNILRDVPQDLRIGRCYLPKPQLAHYGLTPQALLDVGNSQQAAPILMAGIRQALAHFEAAETYLLGIPRRCIRLRLAALWPLLIGLATLAELARQRHRWLDPEHCIKVTRPWVYRMMLRSCVSVFCNRLLKGWLASLRGKVTCHFPPSASR